MSSPIEDSDGRLDELVVDARRRAAEMGDRSAALREDALGRVVRWQWATSESQLHRVEPFVREREDLRSRKLLAEPREYEYDEEYGYDAQGRIVVARAARLARHESRYREELIFHHESRLESWTYWNDGEPLGVAIHQKDDRGRLRYVARARVDGSLDTEYYVWDADRVQEVHSAADSPTDKIAWWRGVDEVEYDEAGRPAVIYATWQSSEGSRDRQVVWRAPSVGPSPATLLRRIGESLRLHLLEAVRGTVAFVPWAAVLYYDEERPAHGSLVVAGAGVREHFEAVVREAPDDEWARLALWNPAEWLSSGLEDVRQFCFDELASDLTELIANYEAAVAGENDDGSAAVRLIRRIAKRLYAELSEEVEVAADFVVYPLDLELTELPKGLKATVPKDVVARYASLLP